MAEAYGKLTGRPGICLVTRGPGATQASVGVHTAFQDATPLVLLVGQIRRGDVGREAFQELDYRQVFGSLAKWVAQIDQVERIPELVARAFRTATSGRPGPVVLALPEDVLGELADVADAAPYAACAGGARRRRARGAARAAGRSGASARDRRRAAVDGGGGPAARRLARGERRARRRRVALPGLRRQRRACYAGHLGLGQDPALTARLRDADVLLVVGARLGDIETAGYSTVVPPGAGRTLIHVHPDPDELGRVYEPALGIVASGPRFAERARRAGAGRRERAGELDAAHAAYLATLEDGVRCPAPSRWREVMRALRERLPPDAIVASGAGNFSVWAHRFYVFRRYRTQLAPLSGAMGYGLPAADRGEARPSRAATSSASRATATS